jgi:hypothetical protein
MLETRGDEGTGTWVFWRDFVERSVFGRNLTGSAVSVRFAFSVVLLIVIDPLT